MVSWFDSATGSASNIRKLLNQLVRELVSLIFVSWNRIADWLNALQHLRSAA